MKDPKNLKGFVIPAPDNYREQESI